MGLKFECVELIEVQNADAFEAFIARLTRSLLAAFFFRRIGNVFLRRGGFEINHFGGFVSDVF